VFVLINDQAFTKTANLWGVSNNRVGTNTNRVVLLRKSGESPLRPRGRRVVGGAKGAQIRLFEVPVRLHAIDGGPPAEERQFARGTVEGMPVTPRRHAPLPERGGDACMRPRTEHRLAYSAEVSRPVAASGASCAWMTRPSNFSDTATIASSTASAGIMTRPYTTKKNSPAEAPAFHSA